MQAAPMGAPPPRAAAANAGINTEMADTRQQVMKDQVLALNDVTKDLVSNRVGKAKFSHFDYGDDNMELGPSPVKKNVAWARIGTSGAVLLEQNDTQIVIDYQFGDGSKFLAGHETGFELNCRIPITNVTTDMNTVYAQLSATQMANGVRVPDMINIMKNTLAVREGFPWIMFEQIKISHITSGQMIVQFDNMQELHAHFMTARRLRTLGKRFTNYHYDKFHPTNTAYEDTKSATYQSNLIGYRPETKYGAGFDTVTQVPAADTVTVAAGDITMNGYIEMWLNLSLFELLPVLCNLGSDYIMEPLVYRYTLKMAPIGQWLFVGLPDWKTRPQDANLFMGNPLATIGAATGALNVTPALIVQGTTATVQNAGNCEVVTTVGLNAIINNFNGKLQRVMTRFSLLNNWAGDIDESLLSTKMSAVMGANQKYPIIYGDAIPHTTTFFAEQDWARFFWAIFVKILNIRPTFVRENTKVKVEEGFVGGSVGRAIKSGVRGGESIQGGENEGIGMTFDWIRWQAFNQVNSRFNQNLPKNAQTLIMYDANAIALPDWILIGFTVHQNPADSGGTRRLVRAPTPLSLDITSAGNVNATNIQTLSANASADYIYRRRVRHWFVRSSSCIDQGGTNWWNSIDTLKIQWTCLVVDDESQGTLPRDMEVFEYQVVDDKDYYYAFQQYKKFMLMQTVDLQEDQLSKEAFAQKPFLILQLNKSSGQPEPVRTLPSMGRLAISMSYRAIPDEIEVEPFMMFGNMNSINIDTDSKISCARNTMDASRGIGAYLW